MAVQRTASLGTAGWAVESANIEDIDPVTTLASVDPDRGAVTIINDSDSPNDVWIVPTSTRKTGGFRLAPGAALELRTASPVYGYVKTGTAIVYSITESGVLC